MHSRYSLVIILLGLALTVIGPYLSVQGAMAIPTNADKTTSPPSTTNGGDGGTGDTPNPGDSNNGNGGNGGTADHFSSANGGNGGTRNILNSGFSRNGNGGNGGSIDTKINELKWTIYDD
jgi:hypothetical protein